MAKRKEGAAQAPAALAANPSLCASASLAGASHKPLAGNRSSAQHQVQQNDPARDLFHHFLRALARDTARRDHAADPD